MGESECVCVCVCVCVHALVCTVCICEDRQVCMVDMQSNVQYIRLYICMLVFIVYVFLRVVTFNKIFVPEFTGLCLHLD